MEEERTTRNSSMQTSSISFAKKIRKTLKIREFNNPPCTNFGRDSTTIDSVILLMNLNMSRRFLCSNLISLLRNLFLTQKKTRLCVTHSENPSPENIRRYIANTYHYNLTELVFFRFDLSASNGSFP
jgi:hypothetical protein